MNKTTHNALRGITISAVIALGFSTNTPAAGLAAGQPVSDGVNSYVVRYADLDLSKMAGTTALYSRIGHAARVVCRTLDSREMDIAAKYRSCMADAVANAVASVDRPLLSQYHELRTKGDKTGTIQLARAN